MGCGCSRRWVSVPTLIFASQFVAHALERYPLLIPAGGALLGWVAGELAVADPAIKGWIDAQSFPLTASAPVIGAAGMLAIGLGVSIGGGLVNLFSGQWGSAAMGSSGSALFVSG